MLFLSLAAGLHLPKQFVESFLLLIVEDSKDSLLAIGANLVHLRLEHLNVHHEIVQHHGQMLGLYWGKFKFVAQPLERNFPPAILPEWLRLVHEIVDAVPHYHAACDRAA
jgi:hypothetical protein